MTAPMNPFAHTDDDDPSPGPAHAGLGTRARLKRLLFRALPARWYLRMYAHDTDRRVETNPERASGAPGEIMGPRVLAYVKAAGLEPRHRLLDFGCGTLRTGRYLIRYLDPGRYVGVDISEGAIAYSRSVIARHRNLKVKGPEVWRVAPFEPLDLPWAPDYLLCHSVFTHLPRQAAQATFRQLRAVMTPEATLVFTAFVGGAYAHRSYKDIVYTVPELVEMAAEAGIAAAVFEGDWPLNQTIFTGRARAG
jgi:SAM-dependent methyltransferase